MSMILRLPKTLPDGNRQARTLSPAVKAAALHAICIPIAALLAEASPAMPAWQGLEALLAVIGGMMLGLAPWWSVINAAFVPGLHLALMVDFSPAWALGAFFAMLLIYWSVARTQVPLFLSTDAAISALLRLLPAISQPNFIDLGCGTGHVIAHLAGYRRDGRFDGIECAPLPWLVAWLRLSGARARCSIRQGDFWQRDLAQYNVVYAYLSPVPMVRLWQKARHEMRAGTLLISNTFEVPGVTADEVIELGDAWGGRLYLYRM